MTNAIILKCRPESQFHFGRGGMDVEAALHDTAEWLHSDTLFSALLSTAAQIVDVAEVDGLRKAFESGSIRISSGFYCLENNQLHEDELRYLYFLPRPEHYILHEEVDFKSVARLQFISKGVWESGLTPQKGDWHNPKQIFQHKFMVTEEEAQWLDTLEPDTKIYSVVTNPRVYARRSGETDTFYFLSNVVLHRLPKPWSVHFYFLLDANAETRETAAFKLLTTAIDLLPDTGIGGERSGGCGRLDAIEWQDFKLEVSNPGGYVSVSLSLPADQTDFDQFRFYKTLLRGGRNTAADKKLDFIRMIGEGAYLNAKANGRIELLRQGKDVPYYRNGMTFCLPVHADTQPPKP